MRVAADIQAGTVTITLPATGPGTSEHTETQTVAMPKVESDVLRVGWSDEEMHVETPADGEPAPEGVPGKGSIVRAGDNPGEQVHEGFTDRGRIEPFIAAFDAARTQVNVKETLAAATETTKPIPTAPDFAR